jgi:hypothetical protein
VLLVAFDVPPVLDAVALRVEAEGAAVGSVDVAAALVKAGAIAVEPPDEVLEQAGGGVVLV